MFLLFPYRGIKSYKVVVVSAYIKVWNPNQNPIQINDDGISIAGLSEGEIDSENALAKSALAAGLLVPINGAVPPVDEGQVANSVEVETADVVSAAAEEVLSDPVEEEKPKPSRSKSQASKES